MHESQNNYTLWKKLVKNEYKLYDLSYGRFHKIPSIAVEGMSTMLPGVGGKAYKEVAGNFGGMMNVFTVLT